MSFDSQFGGPGDRSCSPHATGPLRSIDFRAGCGLAPPSRRGISFGARSETGRFRVASRPPSALGGFEFACLRLPVGPGKPILVAAIVTFFQTGVSPVPPRESIEILAFMEAGYLSKQRGGQTVTIAEVMKRAGAPPEP